MLLPAAPRKAHAGCSPSPALGWIFIGANVMLPFSQWPAMPAVGRVLLIAASVLSVGSGFVLLFWAADAVRDRS